MTNVGNDPIKQMASRKKDHLAICLEKEVDSPNITTGFECYRFVHNALPEINADDIDTSCVFLGKKLNMPLIISPMTGGTEKGKEINTMLAHAAQEFGIGMSVGSQRIALADQSLAHTFNVREFAPNVLLFANLGAAQLNYGLGVDDCKRAVDMIGADALTLHLNPIQERIQSEGNTNFSGLLRKIDSVCSALEVPVVVKGDGTGMSASTATLLANAGASAIDVSGAGGTSWALIEGYRAENATRTRLGNTFAGWGIPTARCVTSVCRAMPHIPLIASGGLRTGIDVAKSIALGASVGAMALPLLRAAATSYDSLSALIQAIRDELTTCMFGIACRCLDSLHRTAAIEQVLPELHGIP